MPSTPHPTTAMYSSSVEEEEDRRVVVEEDDAIAAENEDEGGGMRWRGNIGEDGIEEKHVDDATDDDNIVVEVC